MNTFEERRAAGIYAFGDPVVFFSQNMTDKIVHVEKITKVRKLPMAVAFGRFGNFKVTSHEVRHATDEELKLGKRI